MLELNLQTGKIINTAYLIHREIGPGLLESVYETILFQELQRIGLKVERQKPIPIKFHDIYFDEGFRADLVVDDRIIVELKSVERVLPLHKKQVLTYLRLTRSRVGLLINFGENLFKDGVHRIINGF